MVWAMTGSEARASRSACATACIDERVQRVTLFEYDLVTTSQVDSQMGLIWRASACLASCWGRSTAIGGSRSLLRAFGRRLSSHYLL
jgi:hypothetical protein